MKIQVSVSKIFCVYKYFYLCEKMFIYRLNNVRRPRIHFLATISKFNAIFKNIKE